MPKAGQSTASGLLQGIKPPLEGGNGSAQGAFEDGSITEAGPDLHRKAGAKGRGEKAGYLRWPETSLVISNMLTCFLPLKTPLRLSSALMRVFFLASCNPFFLI